MLVEVEADELMDKRKVKKMSPTSIFASRTLDEFVESDLTFARVDGWPDDESKTEYGLLQKRISAMRKFISSRELSDKVKAKLRTPNIYLVKLDEDGNMPFDEEEIVTRYYEEHGGVIR